MLKFGLVTNSFSHPGILPVSPFISPMTIRIHKIPLLVSFSLFATHIPTQPSTAVLVPIGTRLPGEPLVFPEVSSVISRICLIQLSVTG